MNFKYVLRTAGNGTFFVGYPKCLKLRFGFGSRWAQILFNWVNMVRAGVVNHPLEWKFGGYNEIQKPRERYTLIDYKRLIELLHISTLDELRNSHKKWAEEILKAKNYVRESKWSQSIAVGSKSFVEVIKEKLGIRAKSRKVGRSGEFYHLREAQVPYNSDFTTENSDLRAINTYYWIDNP
jgi:putative transposase